MSEAMELALPSDLGIESLDGLHALLAPAVASAAPVTLAAGDVSRIHAASLQLLAAFCRDRRQADAETHWSAPSTTLRQAVDNLGLNSWFDLPQEHA